MFKWFHKECFKRAQWLKRWSSLDHLFVTCHEVSEERFKRFDVRLYSMIQQVVQLRPPNCPTKPVSPERYHYYPQSKRWSSVDHPSVLETICVKDHQVTPIPFWRHRIKKKGINKENKNLLIILVCFTRGKIVFFKSFPLFINISRRWSSSTFQSSRW